MFWFEVWCALDRTVVTGLAERVSRSGPFYLSKHLTFESFLQATCTRAHTNTERDGRRVCFCGDLTIPQLLDVNGANCSTSLLDTEPEGILSGQSLSFPLSPDTHIYIDAHTRTHTPVVNGPRQPRNFYFTGR